MEKVILISVDVKIQSVSILGSAPTIADVMRIDAAPEWERKSMAQ